MTEPVVEQRLVAILAADVAGYTRLMADDEVATLASLDAARAIFRDHVQSERGRIVDTAGDSVLAVFATVSGAVRAALRVQSTLANGDAGVPEMRRMRFRVGVNLGEVIEKSDGSVYGAGVNVAARLQGLAEPGAVMISEDAYRQVRRNRDLVFVDFGEHELKNVGEPVRGYLVAHAESPTPALIPIPRTMPSIAVLPFTNMSGDPEQEYFSDGLSEDIITDLSKLSGLFVTARNSAFTYKGRPVNVGIVCRELSVRYVVEGSVRKAGGQVRITAQLIDGTTGGHVWAERYDRQLDDIFAVQDDVTRSIVAALKVSLTPQEQNILVQRGTNNLNAYDAFMRGREWTTTWTRTGHEKARPWLEKAIALDPGFAAPMAFLAMIFGTAYVNRWGEDWQNGLSVSYELAIKAVALAPQSPHAHYALGTCYLWKKQLENSIAEQARAIDLDPNYALGHTMMGMALHFAGDSARALEFFDTALRLDPISSDVVLHQMGLCHYMLGDYDAAETVLRKRISQTPSTDSSRALLAATYGRLGRTKEARAVWQELMAVNPNYSFAERQKIFPYRNPDDLKNIADGLREAEIEV